VLGPFQAVVHSVEESIRAGLGDGLDRYAHGHDLERPVRPAIFTSLSGQ
jgi:hypothetical protein